MGMYLLLIFLGIILLLLNFGYNVWKYWPVILIAIGVLGIIDRFRRKQKLHFWERFYEKVIKVKYLNIEVIRENGEVVSKIKMPVSVIKLGVKFILPYLNINSINISSDDLKKVFETPEEVFTFTDKHITVKMWVE